MASNTIMHRNSRSESLNDSIKKSWENVVLKGLSPKNQLRPEILNSWRKCREIGLDPFSKNLPPVYPGKNLDKLLQLNQKLIDVSKQVLDMIEISVRDSGFVVVLTNNKGQVLKVQGDGEILKMAEENFCLPGSFRNIENAGTNAIGVCLIEGKPIQTTGAEHYKVHHHPWTCSTAPIHDSRREMIGTITLMGQSVGRHQHTLALVKSAAETIGSQLRERDLVEEKQSLNSILSLIFNAISDGVIAVDNDMKIVRLNKHAAEMLGLNTNSVIGQRLGNVVQPENTLIHSLIKRKYFTARDISFTCPTGMKSYLCSVDPVGNASGHIQGAIITLTKKGQVINLAKKIGGNHAKYKFENIIGKNTELLKQIELSKVAATTNSRILIIGESGTGKELFAQSIHNSSNRRNEPFVAISCAAIPRDIIESELFGYRGGAFTGARINGQVGKFELAHKGTLFLDEINGLPLDMQIKLLRALQQNEILRLGDTQTIPVDTRVIAASNIDLMTEVANDNFREDLYYRLNVVEIFIPPLRKRMDDLELLINHIMKRHCREMAMKLPEISEEVFTIIRNYHWPGNVRELENCLERAVLLSHGKVIDKMHIPDRVWKRSNDSFQTVRPLREGFREMIEATLNQYGGNVSIAARQLKIARSTLYRKMKEFGLPH